MRRLCCVFLLLLLFSSIFFSEYIVLKNGNAITGIIKSISADSLIIETADGKTIEIKKVEVLAIQMQQPETIAQVPQQQNAAIQSPINYQGYPAPVPSTVLPVETPYYTVDMELESRKRLLMFQERSKNPLLSVGLSLVLPGSGHIYTERWGHAVFFLATRSVFSGIAVWGFWSVEDVTNPGVFTFNNPVIGTIGAVGLVVITVMESIDSYQSTIRYNDMLRLRLGIDQVDPMLVPVMP